MFTPLLLTAVLSIQPPATNGALSKELAQFEGKWTLVSMVLDGTKFPEDQLRQAEYVIKGNQFSMTYPGGAYKGTIKLDVAKKPKHIDFHFLEGPEKGKTSIGIYEFEGDLLKVCFSQTGGDRPKEFISKNNSGHVLQVLKRDK